MRISMKNGIEIEPIKIGWLQLLIAAGVVGGYAVTLATVVASQSKSTIAINGLNATVGQLNNTMIEMKTDQKYNRLDIETLKKQSSVHAATNQTQNEQIIELQLVTGIRK